jgi:hypothetical protein
LLVGHLEAAGHICIGQFDLPIDARVAKYEIPRNAVIITNPPGWGRGSRTVLHPIIENLSDQATVWLLMPGSWLFNVSSAPLFPRLRLVVPAGRHKWFPGTKYPAKDDVCWMKFTEPRDEPAIIERRRRSWQPQIPTLTIPRPSTTGDAL